MEMYPSTWMLLLGRVIMQLPWWLEIAEAGWCILDLNGDMPYAKNLNRRH